MRGFSDAYEEMNQDLRLRVLVVYNAWRGAFDTLKLFVESLDSFKNISLVSLDWKKDSWIMAEQEIVSLKAVGDVAKSFRSDIVLLLGSCLRLDEPAPTDSPTTYSSYYISTLNNEKRKVENFDFAHFRYTAHKYNMRPGFRWLPTSVNLNVFDDFSSNNPRKDNGKCLCLWNQSLLKAEERERELAALKSAGIEHECFGSLTKNSVNSYDAMKKMRESRAVLDDNRDGVVGECQYNDRFSSACALKVPVVARKCDDLDQCFDHYVGVERERSFADQIESITKEELDHSAEQNYLDINRRHRNEFRWAEIMRDHLQRTNKG